MSHLFNTNVNDVTGLGPLHKNAFRSITPWKVAIDLKASTPTQDSRCFNSTPAGGICEGSLGEGRKFGLFFIPLNFKEGKYKMFKKLRSTFLAFVMGILLAFAGVALAQAQSYTSAIRNFGPYAGYSYWNYCSISCDPNNTYLWGYANVNSSSGNVPQYYIGLSAYVYTNDGVCVANTPWTYNTYSTDFWYSGDTWKLVGLAITIVTA